MSVGTAFGFARERRLAARPALAHERGQGLPAFSSPSKTRDLLRRAPRRFLRRARLCALFVQLRVPSRATCLRRATCSSDSPSFDFNSPANASSANSASSTGSVTGRLAALFDALVVAAAGVALAAGEEVAVALLVGAEGCAVFVGPVVVHATRPEAAMPARSLRPSRNKSLSSNQNS